MLVFGMGGQNNCTAIDIRWAIKRKAIKIKLGCKK